MVLARSRRVRAGARDQPERDDENPRSPGEGSALGRYRSASEVVKPRRFRADGDGHGPGRGRRLGAGAGAGAARRGDRQPRPVRCPLAPARGARPDWHARRLRLAGAAPRCARAVPGVVALGTNGTRSGRPCAVRRACTDES